MSNTPGQGSVSRALTLTSALLIAFAVAFFLYYGLNTMTDPVFSIDFCPYHEAGRLLAQGNLVPLTNYAESGGFFANSGPFLDYFHQHFFPQSEYACRWVYLPAYAWIFRPLAGLDFHVASKVWLAINALICLACVGLLWHARRRPEKDKSLSHWRLAWYLFLGLTFQPMLSNLMHGQVSGLILLCFCVSYWLLRRERPLAAGLALGLIAPLKFYPALFVVYFIWRRQWRVVAGAVVAGLAVMVVSLMTVGLEGNLRYFEVILTELKLGGMPSFNNESILGFLLHAFTGGDVNMWADITVPFWLVVVRVVLILILVIVSVWTMRRRPGLTADPVLARDLDLSLVVFVMLLASPITWYHYYIWLLVPLYVLFDWLLLAPDRRSGDIVLLAVAYGLVVVEGIMVIRPIAAQALDNVWVLRIMLSQSFFGAVLLAVLTLKARRVLSRTVQEP